MRFVALLRGINLGSHHRLAMPELKTACEGVGLETVDTYLQSGNIVFASRIKDTSQLTGRIRLALKTRFEHDISVIVKTAAEMRKIVRNNPFLARRGMDPTKLHVTFLQTIPAHDHVVNFSAQLGSSDEWAINGSVIYLYCPNGYGRTKLTNTVFERKLQVRATTRNWKTVTALADLVDAES